MGSGEEGASAKSAVQAHTEAAANLVGQEVPATPTMYQDWQSMAAAYYGGAAGTPPGFFSPSPQPHPYMWPAPHMITPYGPSIPYPHMYATGMYPHPGMAQGTNVTAVEFEGRLTDGKDRSLAKSSKDGTGTKSGDGTKVTSAPEEPSQSGESGESGTEGSTSAGEGEANAQGSGKRNYDKMIGSSDGIQYGGVGIEAPGCVRGQPATTIPIPLPGKVAATAPATNLNIGMDIWSAPHAGSIPLKDRPNALSAMDERELKRQRRKQSNRESARRSRLRKQQECEDLAKKVEELSAENGKLRSEIDHLKEQCKKLETENASIKEELSEAGGHNMLSALEAKSHTRTVDVSSDHRGLQNTDGATDHQSNGSFLRSNGSH